MAGVNEDRRRHLDEVREALMSTAGLRAGAESLVGAFLLELEGRPDEEVVTELGGCRVDIGLERELTVGELRSRLRWTLTELAIREGAS